MRENPPWANRALKQHWGEVESVGLPMPVESENRWKFEEYGCGHYGCVMPTSREGVVFKLTSDPTEAEFVELAMPLGWPDGIVEYYAIIPLEGFTFRRRQVYALWREEAYEVGKVYEVAHRLQDWQEQNMHRFVRRLQQFQAHAARFQKSLQNARNPAQNWAEAKELINEWAWKAVDYERAEGKMELEGYATTRRRYRYLDSLRGPERLAASWRACELIAELMGQEEFADSIGGAFEYFMSHGFLLADVHWGNIGQVERDDYINKPWVITDPGHVIVLNTY